ncbi:hypothetical protein [Brevundimonas aurifodinae]|uniref:Uncharacterized protein n=1 Tax=Brevundimonas aurifodinae TaxID=1508312 RepID=A0ABV1NK81_9CAUL
MACVSIQLLSSSDIDEAYVLARLCDAGLTLKAWRARAACFWRAISRPGLVGSWSMS